MAESFYTIIDRGTMDVEHQGDSINVRLPGYLRELSGHLDDHDFLAAWATADKTRLIAIVQTFIQKDLIDCRQITRPSVRTLKSKEAFLKAKADLSDPDNWLIDDRALTITKSIIADAKAAQERLSGKTLTIAQRPGSGAAKDPDKTLKQLMAAGLTPEELMAKLQAIAKG